MRRPYGAYNKVNWKITASNCRHRKNFLSFAQWNGIRTVIISCFQTMIHINNRVYLRLCTARRYINGYTQTGTPIPLQSDQIDFVCCLQERQIKIRSFRYKTHVEFYWMCLTASQGHPRDQTKSTLLYRKEKKKKRNRKFHIAVFRSAQIKTNAVRWTTAGHSNNHQNTKTTTKKKRKHTVDTIRFCSGRRCIKLQVTTCSHTVYVRDGTFTWNFRSCGHEYVWQ